MGHRDFDSPLIVEPGRSLRGPGDWDRHFGRRAPLEVEVGFGRDDGLLRRAASRPDENFIGIELRRDRVATYCGRVEQAGLTNLRIVPGRAEVVLGILLLEESVRTVRILFPDPWPKAKHADHRLVQPWFVRIVRRVLEVGGELILATDDANYQEQMREVMAEAAGFERMEIAEADERSDDDGSTIFERKWVAKGRTPLYFRFRRVS